MQKYYTTVAMNGEMIDEFNTEEEDRVNGFEPECPNGDYEVSVGDDAEVNACTTTQEFVWRTENV